MRTHWSSYAMPQGEVIAMKPLDNFHGNPWQLMESHGKSRVVIGARGNCRRGSWLPIRSDGTARNAMNLNEMP